MRVIVTRVQPQARQWAQALAQQGHDAVALPLIDIRGLADTQLLQQAWQQLAHYTAVMFVSAHAVNYFYEQNKALALSGQALIALNIRAWTTGPASRAAVLAQGLPAGQVDSPPVEAGQFDSEALWQTVQGQIGPGARVLIVRGDTPGSPAASPQGVGRDWLAQRLQAAGAQVEHVVAYQRGAPVWSTAQAAVAAAAATDGSVWLLSSTEAVANLRQLLPGQDWSAARAVATHARIAGAARQAGFGRVVPASPTLASVLASIESLA
jgi:uroporphyrinogen-III synthase